MTTSSTCCCGVHVITCAKIIAILGIISSAFSILSSIALWFYLPVAVVMLLTYIFVLVGINKQKPSYLLPAEIILAINLIFNCLIVIGLLIFAFFPPEFKVETKDNSAVTGIQTEKHTTEVDKTTVRVAFIFMAIVCALVSLFVVFALLVIHRARKYLLSPLPGVGTTHTVVVERKY